MAVGINKEATVEVPAPSNAKVGAAATHYLSRGCAIFRQQRIRNAVRKTTVRFVMDTDELKRKVRRQLVDHQIGPAVAGTDHDLQWAQGRTVNVRSRCSI